MKKLKSKLLILLLALMVPVTSLLFAKGNEGDDVYAKTGTYSKLSNTASKDFVVSDDLNWTKVTKNDNTMYEFSLNLYSIGEDTLNYYNIEVSYEVSDWSVNTGKPQDRTFEDSTLYLHGDSTLNPTVTYLVTAKVVLPEYMVGNECYNYQLSAYSSNSTMTINGAEDVLNGALTTSNELEITYSMVSSDNTKFSITAPVLTITCDDITAPTINVSDSNTDNSSIYRTINFDVSDEETGVKEVKYYKGTKDNHNASDEVILDKSESYSFNAEYKYDYTIEVTDYVGNIATYVVSKDTSNNLNPSISDLVVSNRNKEIKFNLSYTPNTTKHSAEDGIYYAIFTLQEYMELGNNKSQLISKVLDNSCGKLSLIGSNTVSIDSIEDGTYYIIAVAKDMAGNVCDQVATAMFKRNTTKYTLTLSQLDGGHYTKVLIGEEDYFDGDLSNYTLDIYTDEVYSIGFEADNGYLLTSVVANGSNVTNKDNYTDSCASDIEINAHFKYIINASFAPSFTFEYCNDNMIDNVLSSFELKSAETKEISEVVDLIDLIEFEMYDKDGNLVFTHGVDGILNGEFYNVGNYTIKWRIASAYIGDYIQTNTDDILVQIVPKEIVGLSTTYMEGLEYSGQGHQLSVSWEEDTNIIDVEKLELAEFITFTYYLSSDVDMNNPMSSMINAGTYFAKISITSPNYGLANNTIENIIVNKKVVSINVTKSIFEYNQESQNIEFENDGNLTLDQFNIAYQVEEDGTYLDSQFKNVGNYKYIITLKPEFLNNYNLIECMGECEIRVQNIYISLNKDIYDYTGANVIVDFALYIDEEKNIGVDNKNNVITALSIGEQLLEVGEYAITFQTSDNGYNLILDLEGYTINIVRTKINIRIENNYEFDGNNKEIIYGFYKSEEVDGEELFVKLENVVGISLQLFDSENNEVEEICNVGTYKYVFTANKKFDVNESELTGEIYINKAKIYVDFALSEYEYLPNTTGENLDIYNVSYVIKSNKTNDIYAGVQFVDVQISKVNDDSNWGDVGVYTYTFATNNENVELYVADETLATWSHDIQIVPRKISVRVQDNFVYSSEAINFQFEIIGDNYGVALDDISYSIIFDGDLEEIKDAGLYEYSMFTSNNNYEIVISNDYINGKHYITVAKKAIEIESMENIFTYNGQEIVLDITLANPYGEEIDYIVKENGQIARILDAKTYEIVIESTNGNYYVANATREIIVKPMKLIVVLDDNLSLEYDKTNKSIAYHFVDEKDNNVENIASVVIFSKDGNILSSICNAGVYTFEIKLDGESNYCIDSITGNISIAPKVVSVSAKASQSKVYGEQDPTEIVAVITGVIDDDEVSVQLARVSGEDVGLYKIYYVDNSLSNSNYEVNFKNDTYFFEITPKKLIIMADSKEKTFGEDDEVLTYKMYLDGNLSDTLLFEKDILTGNLTRENGEDVGSYAIKLGDLNNDNYSIIFVSNKYTISPKDLNVVIDDITTTYGENKNLTYTIEEDFESEYIFGSIARVSGDDVGTYTISKGTLSSKNYNLIVTNGTYTINAKDVYVYANASEKIYGDVDNLTYTAVGLINNDQLQGSIARSSGEDVGTYNITQGSLYHKNYNIIFTSNTLTIQKASLSVLFHNKTQVYGQSKVPLTYEVEGLKFNDTIEIRPYRESGEDVGEYQITGAIRVPSNYYLDFDNLTTGVYAIEKAKLNLNLKSKTVTYNGKPHTLEVEGCEYPIKLLYKSITGADVVECVDAGIYTVQAIFEGNNNYEPAKSKEANLIINKQYVHITILNSSFIYDGTIKYPEYSYDKNIGIDSTSFVFKFENDIFPQEEGEYNFSIIISDDNYEGEAQGQVKIQKTLSITNENSSIVECENATFDENSRNIKLVQDNDTKKFNNEKVISVCSLENVSESASGYIYTVKVKAVDGVDTVKVYKVSTSGFSQQAIKIEDGYYVFKIDNPDDKYIITTEIKTLSTLAWITIIVAIVLVFTIILIIIAKHKHKKVKVKDGKPSNKDIETYNVN